MNTSRVLDDIVRRIATYNNIHLYTRIRRPIDTLNFYSMSIMTNCSRNHIVLWGQSACLGLTSYTHLSAPARGIGALHRGRDGSIVWKARVISLSDVV